VNGTKEFYLSKTFWFNVLALVLAVAGVFGFAEFVPSEDVQSGISAVSVLVAAAVPVANIILRFLTDTKIRV
jgi:hypothetical protein